MVLDLNFNINFGGASRSNSNNSSLFQENVLNRYESYTYSWALHMIHPQSADPANFASILSSTGNFVTLAQSGVENEISIQSVTQNMILTFNSARRQNRQSVANVFTVDFLEPGGATFFTRLVYAAAQLGIENHLRACYIFELRFKGWDANGNAVDPIPDAGPFYYCCYMPTLTFSFDGASLYRAELFETVIDAFSQSELYLASDVTLYAETYGEFLQELQTQIQEQEDRRVQVGQSTARVLPHQYKLQVGSENSDWNSFVFEATTYQDSSRGISVEPSSDGRLRFVFPAGTGINDAMSLGLLHTLEFRRIVVESGFAKDNPEDVMADPSALASLVRWFVVDTETRYLRYDPIARSYAKEMTYIINPYISPEAQHDPSSQMQLFINQGLQQQRISSMFSQGLIKKRFDYYYTGLNTEVLDMNLQLNNLYYQVFPQNVGIIRFPEQYFNGSGNEDLFQIHALRTDLSEITSRVSSLASQRDSILNRLSGRDADAYVAGGVTPLGDQTALSSINAEYDLLTRQQAGISRQLNDLYNSVVENTLYTTPSGVNTGGRYITQSQLSSFDTDQLLPGFDYEVIESLATSGPENEQGGIGAVLLGAMEVNLNAAADLVEMDLLIRGDPYWLGRPSGAGSNGAAYDVGGISYFLNVNFPTYPSDRTGLVENIGEYSIKGVYRVTQVVAEYANGTFEMRLSSFRDNVSNTQLIDQYLEQGFVPSGSNALPSVAQSVNANSTDVDSQATESVRRTGDTGVNVDFFATGNSPAGGHEFANGVRAELTSLLASAANATGVRIVTTPEGGYRIGGSLRHEGYASDIVLYSGDRALTVASQVDRDIIQNFTRIFRDQAIQAGFTPSVGWANHTDPVSQWYMDGAVGHYDIALDTFLTRQTVNSLGQIINRSTYWGNGSSTSGAPDWLSSLMRGI